MKTGPEVIKLEFSLKLEIKLSDWLLYFEFENELEFYNLGAGFHFWADFENSMKISQQRWKIH